jgi:DNA polymerase III epsilon subunit-like protein
MLIFVFDTETTGLPKTKFINPDKLNEWPYIVQLSYIIYDTSINEIILIQDHIIKMENNVNICEESSKIHGITNEISKIKGKLMKDVMEEFFYYIRNCDLIVGHNVSFDINMLKVELLRLRMIQLDMSYSDEYIKNVKLNLCYLNTIKNIYCTLQESIELCNIQAISKTGKPYLKFPKLIELHKKLFETTPNNLHNALNDIVVTLRCFIKMKYNIDLNNNCITFDNLVDALQLL